MRWTESCEGSGGAALVDTLSEALQISMGLVLLVIQDCENMLCMS